MNFSKLLDEARDDASNDLKQMHVVINNPVVRRVLDFLEEMDIDGFDEMLQFESKYADSFREHEQKQEHKTEHKSHHSDFCDMFERKVEDFIARQGVTVDAFYEEVRCDIAMNGEDSDGGRVLALIRSATDYSSWAEHMHDIAAVRRGSEEERRRR